MGTARDGGGRGADAAREAIRWGGWVGGAEEGGPSLPPPISADQTHGPSRAQHILPQPPPKPLIVDNNINISINIIILLFIIIFMNI